jgi:hypothetical protein
MNHFAGDVENLPDALLREACQQMFPERVAGRTLVSSENWIIL